MVEMMKGSETMATKSELEGMDNVALRTAAKAAGVNPAGMKTADLIRAILKAQSGGSTPADPGKKITPGRRPAPATPPATPPAPSSPKIGAKITAPKAAPVATPPKASPPAAPKGPTAEERIAKLEEVFTAQEGKYLKLLEVVSGLSDRLDAALSSDEPAEAAEVIDTGDEPAAETTPEPEEEEQSVDEAAIMKMRLPDLRKVCKDNDIPFKPTDKEADLRKILLDAINGGEEPAATEPASDDIPEVPAELAGLTNVSGKSKPGDAVIVYAPEMEEYGDRTWEGVVSQDDGSHVSEDNIFVAFAEDNSQAWLPMAVVYAKKKAPPKAR